MPSRSLFLAIALVGGCGGNSGNNTADMAPGGCTSMGKDVPAYTGDDSGALAATGPVVVTYAPDAKLASIYGSQVLTQTGQTTSMFGSWAVTFYSPSLAHNFIGSFSGASGHVGCQDVKVPVPPPAEPNPQLNSADVVGTAVSRIMVDSPNAKIPGVCDAVNFGKVAAGGNPPHDQAWMVSIQPWIVIVDDNSNTAVECTRSGSPCN